MKVEFQENVVDRSSGCPNIIRWIVTREENLHVKTVRENKTVKSTLATMFSNLCLLDILGLDFQFTISQHVG